MPVRKMIDSFNYALDGVIFALRTQRNMRIHLLITILLILLGVNFQLSRSEIIALTFCVTLVFVTEMINTAIEAAIDLFTREYHELAKIARDKGLAAQSAPDIQKALGQAAMLAPAPRILICGSLYLAGHVLALHSGETPSAVSGAAKR